MYTRKDVYRLSFTKKCSMRKLAVVNTTKKIPSRDIFGHQNDYRIRTSAHNLRQCKHLSLTWALRPNIERMVAAGTSNSTPYWSEHVRRQKKLVTDITLISFNCRYLSSFTASASKAAWKNETVCNHWKAGVTVSLLIRRPVKRRLWWLSINTAGI